jgi:hypothetical protein
MILLNDTQLHKSLSAKERREKLLESTDNYISGKIDSKEFRQAEQDYMTDYSAFAWEMGRIRLVLKGISSRLIKACSRDIS